MRKTVTAAVGVLVLGVFVLFEATMGFRIFTAEGARRLRVREHPLALPNFELEVHTGEHVRLYDLQGRVVVATFIYTACQTVCLASTAQMGEIRDALPDAIDSGAVHFLSISFDPADLQPRLSRYARNFGLSAENWWMARARQDLQQMLEIFGVTVIPTGGGMFEHNTAFYLLDRQSNLVDIFPTDDLQAVVAAVRERL